MNNSSTRGSYNKLSYIQKVSIINRRLRLGDIANVSVATGYSAAHVSDVVAGKYFNDRIINEAYDVTRGRISNAVKLG